MRPSLGTALVLVLLLAGCAPVPPTPKGSKARTRTFGASVSFSSAVLILFPRRQEGAHRRRHRRRTIRPRSPLRSVALSALRMQSVPAAEALAVQLANDPDSIVRWDALKISRVRTLPPRATRSSTPSVPTHPVTCVARPPWDLGITTTTRCPAN